MKGYAHTIGLPRMLWRMDGWGELETTQNFELVNYTLYDRETFADLDIFMSFNPQTKIASIKRKNNKTSKIKDKNIELYQGFDAAGLGYLVRTLDWKTGQKRSFEFTDGAERYVILLKAGPIEQVQVSAGKFNAIRLDPYLFRVPRTKSKEKPELIQNIQALNTWKQIAEYARIWMALDGTRPYVLVKGMSFIGEVSLELTDLNAQMPEVPVSGK